MAVSGVAPDAPWGAHKRAGAVVVWSQSEGVNARATSAQTGDRDVGGVRFDSELESIARLES